MNGICSRPDKWNDAMETIQLLKNTKYVLFHIFSFFLLSFLSHRILNVFVHARNKSKSGCGVWDGERVGGTNEQLILV